jgi:CheY-specific phosphatase CheX
MIKESLTMIPMSARFTALTFGNRVSAFAGELEALGTAVVRGDDPAQVLDAIGGMSDVSVLLVSSDVGRAATMALLRATKERYPAMPVVWVGDELAGAPLGDFRSSPDALLHEPLSPVGVHHTIVELVQHHYTDTVAELLVTVVGSALRDIYPEKPERSLVRVDTTHRLITEVNSIVALCGSGISGRLLVSSSEATLVAIHRRLLPDSAPPGRLEAEDLAGEIANLAAGKLKYALDQMGVACEIGTPLLVGPAGTTLRTSHGQPALVVEFGYGDGVVRGALTIDRCDDAHVAKLARMPEAPAPEPEADMCFF